jgi:hypothetical protein
MVLVSFAGDTQSEGMEYLLPAPAVGAEAQNETAQNAPLVDLEALVAYQEFDATRRAAGPFAWPCDLDRRYEVLSQRTGGGRTVSLLCRAQPVGMSQVLTA